MIGMTDVSKYFTDYSTNARAVSDGLRDRGSVTSGQIFYNEWFEPGKKQLRLATQVHENLRHGRKVYACEDGKLYAPEPMLPSHVALVNRGDSLEFVPGQIVGVTITDVCGEGYKTFDKYTSEEYFLNIDLHLLLPLIAMNSGVSLSDG